MDQIHSHFSESVLDYDTVADKVVMRNDELHERLIGSVALDGSKELNILDLGCGTGHGISLLLTKFPNAKITGVDFCDRMIENAREKLKNSLKRVRLRGDDFRKMEFGEKYDAVVSAIAIHNVTHEEKNELFGKIYTSLNDGGVFVNGDFVGGETSEMDEQCKNVYQEFLKENLRGGELEAWLRHASEEDMPLALSKQYHMLRNHGFRGIKLVWQFNNEAVYIAEK